MADSKENYYGILEVKGSRRQVMRIKKNINWGIIS